jgi:hypothetical protein
MPTMKNNYKGEITLADGKKYRFTINGTTKVEAHRLLKEAHKTARITTHRKK